MPASGDSVHADLLKYLRGIIRDRVYACRFSFVEFWTPTGPQTSSS